MRDTAAHPAGDLRRPADGARREDRRARAGVRRQRHGEPAHRRRGQVPAGRHAVHLSGRRFTRISRSSVTRPRRKASPRARPAIRAPSTSRPASWCGNSTWCRARASPATKPGARPTAGSTARGRARGGSSPSTPNAVWSSSRRATPRAATTASIARARTASRRRLSAWMRPRAS